MTVNFPHPFPTGFRLIDGNRLNTEFSSPTWSADDAITATAGGGKTNAYQLSATLNRVSTVTTAADSVKLPAAVPGKVVFIFNNGAAAMQVFGSGTDTINSVATGTGVSQPISSIVQYQCVTAGNWKTVSDSASGTSGTFVANGASAVTVANANVAITDTIAISLNTVGGTVGAVPAVKTITGGTGFTVAGTASDTSTYNYTLIKNVS